MGICISKTKDTDNSLPDENVKLVKNNKSIRHTDKNNNTIYDYIDDNKDKHKDKHKHKSHLPTYANHLNTNKYKSLPSNTPNIDVDAIFFE